MAEAFNLLAHAKHIGKVVLSMEQNKAEIISSSSMTFRKDSTYLVTGGCGGFGLATARWMGSKGAGNLVLVGRNGVKSEEDAAIIREIEKSGVRVKVVKADITSYEEVKSLMASVEHTMPTLKGIIHSAMVLDDMSLENLEYESLMKVINPKMLGAWNLHLTTINMQMDFFVMYSSISSVFGNPGQGNYCAANAFLDSFSGYRRSMGLPAVTINWGAIGETGFVSRNEKVQHNLESMGWKTISVEQAMGVLERVLLENPAQSIVADINWKKFKEYLGDEAWMRYSHLEGDSNAAKGKGNTEACGLLKTAMSSGLDESINLIGKRLTGFTAKVLGMPAEKVDSDISLTRMGIDSLMAKYCHK